MREPADNGPIDSKTVAVGLENDVRQASAVISSIRSIAFSVVLSLASLAASAEEVTGKVVAVEDGDTLTVLVDRHPVKVRLTEIDAPEKKQPFGTRSRQSLADLTFGRVVRVVTHGRERYGRTLGRIYVGQQDVNAEQIRRGMAWVFDRYATDRSLYPIQEEARAAKRGLWHDQAPVPPWKWRAEQKAQRKKSRTLGEDVNLRPQQRY